jgi:hypothetical protein
MLTSLGDKKLFLIGGKKMQLNGRDINVDSLEFAPFDYRNENPHLEYAEFVGGQALSDEELYKLEDLQAAELHMQYMNTLY